MWKLASLHVGELTVSEMVRPIMLYLYGDKGMTQGYNKYINMTDIWVKPLPEFNIK